jgi:chromosome segregation ATPase
MDERITKLTNLGEKLGGSAKGELDAYAKKLTEIKNELMGLDKGSQKYADKLKEFNDTLDDARNNLDLVDLAANDLKKTL